MLVRDLGEFELINRIAKYMPVPPADVVVGIGDDVAVLRTSGPEYLLATCDSQIENVHFLRRAITPYQLGRKIVAINMSDIASAGGSPSWALVSLALPEDTEVAFIDGLYQGMREQIQMAGAFIVGGNLSGIDKDIVVDLFLLGRVLPEHLILRSGAREGDLILVTGALGDSRAGLELIGNSRATVPEETRRRVEERHFTPTPRIKEGRILGGSGYVHAMADVSDGLLADLGHICTASKVGAEVCKSDLPISKECKDVSRATGFDAADWALGGGEDYELVFTVSPQHSLEIQRMLESETGTSCRVIGKVLPESEGIHILFPDGSREPLCADSSAGWNHFGREKTK
ncbi:MAG: thiamine-phosphate kinase [Syntrophobacteraceae bacterium]